MSPVKWRVSRTTFQHGRGSSWCRRESLTKLFPYAYRLLVGCLVSVALSACSMARFAYDNADWLLLQKVDSYLDLTSDQGALANALLETRLRDHRIHELPDWIALLERAELLTTDGLTEQDLMTLFEEGAELYQRLVGNSIPFVARLLTTVSPTQVTYLEQQLAEANDEYRDEYLPDSAAKRRTKRTNRTLKRITQWTGRLHDDQRELIERLRNAFPYSAKQWLDYRIAQQQRLLGLLRRNATSGELETFLTAWWVNFDGRDSDLVDKGTSIRDLTTALIVALDQTLEPTQRAHLVAEIRSYRDAFSAITE